MCQGPNSHYFHIIGDKLINPIVGVYIPIIRIPSLKVGGLPSPIQGVEKDPGSYGFCGPAGRRMVKVQPWVAWLPMAGTEVTPNGGPMYQLHFPPIFNGWDAGSPKFGGIGSIFHPPNGSARTISGI